MNATRAEGFSTRLGEKTRRTEDVGSGRRKGGWKADGYEFTMALCHSFFHLSSPPLLLRHFPPTYGHPSFTSLPSLSPVFQALHTRSFPSTHYTHRVNIIYSSDVFFEGRFWRGWNECKSWYEIFDSSSPPHEKSALLERWKIKRSFERS